MADDLYSLGRDIGEAPKASGKNLRKAMQVTAGKVKSSWRKYLNESDNGGIREGSRTIGYDLDDSAGPAGSSLQATIGNHLGGSGSLVWINEFGSLHTGPRGSGATALRDNADDFEKGIEIAIDDTLKGLGL